MYCLQKTNRQVQAECQHKTTGWKCKNPKFHSASIFEISTTTLTPFEVTTLKPDFVLKF